MPKIIFLSLIILSLTITGCFHKTIPALENVDKDQTTSQQTQPEDGQATRQLEDDKEASEQTESTAITIEGTEGWRVYQKEEMNVRLLYHKDWYYDRDEAAEKELGYDLYVGFAKSPDILERGAPYPIEFIIISKDLEWDKYHIIHTRNDKRYIIMTTNKDMIWRNMVKSFEFLDDNDPSSWQVYTNKEYYFEIKYPDYYFSYYPPEYDSPQEELVIFLIDEINKNKVGGTEHSFLKINAYENQDKITIEEWIKNNVKICGKDDLCKDSLERKEIVINNNKGIEVKYLGMGEEQLVYFQNNNYIIELYIFWSENIHDKILSTFKFIDN